MKKFIDTICKMANDVKYILLGILMVIWVIYSMTGSIECAQLIGFMLTAAVLIYAMDKEIGLPEDE